MVLADELQRCADDRAPVGVVFDADDRSRPGALVQCVQDRCHAVDVPVGVDVHVEVDARRLDRSGVSSELAMSQA